MWRELVLGINREQHKVQKDRDLEFLLDFVTEERMEGIRDSFALDVGDDVNITRQEPEVVSWVDRGTHFEICTRRFDQWVAAEDIDIESSPQPGFSILYRVVFIDEAPPRVSDFTAIADC